MAAAFLHPSSATKSRTTIPRMSAGRSRISNRRHTAPLRSWSLYDDGGGSILVTTTDSGLETMRTFEPVVNAPALGATLLVFFVFGLLQLRVRGISRAVERRTTALEDLRVIKARELAGDGVSNAEVVAATGEYEAALDDESRLRTVIPGVRIVAPGAADKNDKDVAAAKRFLGKDLSQERDGLRLEEENTPTNNNNNNNNDTSLTRGWSSGAIALLSLIVISQLGLLYLLSFDPMKANDIFTSVAGPPPDDLPFSSW